MPILENGKMVDGDILTMAEPYVFQSSIEAWIICGLAEEVRELRRAASEDSDDA